MVRYTGNVSVPMTDLREVLARVGLQESRNLPGQHEPSGAGNRHSIFILIFSTVICGVMS